MSSTQRPKDQRGLKAGLATRQRVSPITGAATVCLGGMVALQSPLIPCSRYSRRLCHDHMAQT